MKDNPLFLSAGLLVVACLPLRGEAAKPLPSELYAGAGVLNAFDSSHRNGQLAAAVEYRFSEWKWKVRPMVSALQAEEGTFFMAGGLLYTVKAESGWVFSAGFAPGYYEQGGGKDLGGHLEFYSFAEVGYEFDNGHAVSLRVGHLSNAGLEGHNPGTELVQVGYSLPIGDK